MSDRENSSWYRGPERSGSLLRGIQVARCARYPAPSPASRYIQPSDARPENPENSWSPSRSSIATVQLDGKDGRSETKDGRSQIRDNDMFAILNNPKLLAEWEKFRVIIDQVRVSMYGPSNDSSWTDANMLSLFLEFQKNKVTPGVYPVQRLEKNGELDRPTRIKHGAVKAFPGPALTIREMPERPRG